MKRTREEGIHLWGRTKKGLYGGRFRRRGGRMSQETRGYILSYLQFGNFGTLERHGFAMNRFWSFDNVSLPLPPVNPQSSVDSILKLLNVISRYALIALNFVFTYVSVLGK